nr:MAG TPA: hypothetical protein [Caudoviricetes sp.]
MSGKGSCFFTILKHSAVNNLFAKQFCQTDIKKAYL